MSRITSKAFFDALVSAGVLRSGEYVRRVVVDAQIGHALILHVERYGDERMLNVVQTLDGVEVTGIPAVCGCPLIDTSTNPQDPEFLRGNPAGCPVHGVEWDAKVAAAQERARSAR